MRKISSFNFITLNGYYKDQQQNISWHTHGEEEGQFSAENLKSENILLLGRITYEMMAGFWSSQAAYDVFPEVAEGMNKAEKIVFSRTLKSAGWNNTTLIKQDLVGEMTRLKNTRGKNMTILGSGSIVTQLTEARLIDEYQIMIDPVALGAGTSLFKDIRTQLNLKLISSRTFKSGAILLSYQLIA